MALSKFVHPKSKRTPYAGTWRITHMDQWEEEYRDAEVPAYITIGPTGSGRFQFGYVSGALNGAMSDDFGVEHFAFDWEGNDENDEATGSGWLRIVKPGELEGRLRICCGDNTMLMAELQKTPAGKGK